MAAGCANVIAWAARAHARPNSSSNPSSSSTSSDALPATTVMSRAWWVRPSADDLGHGLTVDGGVQRRHPGRSIGGQHVMAWFSMSSVARP